MGPVVLVLILLLIIILVRNIRIVQQAKAYVVERLGTTAPVAIGFRAKRSNGKYKYFWLYRVKFGIPATNLATKGDSITFSTPTIEGTVMRRNKADTQGNHPWKAEVTEGDTGVADSTITGWYSAVYEPSYTSQGGH